MYNYICFVYVQHPLLVMQEVPNVPLNVNKNSYKG